MELEVEDKFTYESLGQDTFKESNVYELCQVPPVEERSTTRRLGWEVRRAEQHKDTKNKKLTTWNEPVLVLLSLIVILQ
uniref:Uncharacterized protein n=1 Tax=Amphimedon queenslandica TaxID=400682 RepID=A0A1X7SWQ0_AMPQE